MRYSNMINCLISLALLVGVICCYSEYGGDDFITAWSGIGREQCSIAKEKLTKSDDLSEDNHFIKGMYTRIANFGTSCDDELVYQWVENFNSHSLSSYEDDVAYKSHELIFEKHKYLKSLNELKLKENNEVKIIETSPLKRKDISNGLSSNLLEMKSNPKE